MDAGKRAARIRGALTLVILGGLVATALVSPVGAALNKNKVKNIATKAVTNLTYTESEADARFINTGEKATDAEMLDGVDSASFLQSQGPTHISVGPHDWVIGNLNFASGTTNATYYTNQVDFSTTADAEDQVLGVTPDVPVAMYGRSLQLQGLEFCYSTGTNATLDAVHLSVVTNSTSGASGLTAVSATDPTNQTDDACRLYTLPSPFTLTGEHFVTFEAQVDYSDAGTFTVGRTTFVLTHTNTTAGLVSR